MRPLGSGADDPSDPTGYGEWWELVLVVAVDAVVVKSGLFSALDIPTNQSFKYDL